MRKENVVKEDYADALEALTVDKGSVTFASAIFANKPGDGSAREQAASCQRVLGGAANFAREYATKRYRSNLINWGMLPLHTDFDFEVGDFVFLKDIRARIESGEEEFDILVIRKGAKIAAKATMLPLTKEEKEIILAGCLMNYYGAKNTRRQK